MKKILFIFLFALTLESLDVNRDLMLRRLNENVVKQDHVYNSTVKIEILKSLFSYDYNQAQQNSGRLFIRGTIIHE